MLTISVELLHGTVRATGFDDTSIASGVGSSAGEWPLSPARLFSALVAADGTGARQRVTDGTELCVLERAGPPRILASGPAEVLKSQLRGRFVVMDKTHVDNTTRETAAVHEYIGRTAAEVRPGTRLAPASPTLVYLWDDVSPGRELLRALSLRAARVGYLGCADSPARLSVGTAAPDAEDWWVPSDDGTVVLPVPYEGFRDNLDDAFERFSAGEPQRRAWVPNRYARYRPPGEVPTEAIGPVVLWARFDSPVSGRRLLAVTESLRLAVVERYTLDIAGGREDVPSVLTGHGYEGSGYQHALFLALPHVGYRHAGGLLHGAAVLLPPGTPPDIAEAVRSCLWRVRVLARPGSFETGMRPYGGEDRPLAATPGRWRGPSRHWVSATPVVHERFERHGPTLAEVARWCDHAGVIARPVSYRASTVPIGEGALRLSPTEVYRADKPRRPYSHLEVVFDRPVEGPLVVGAARQFGFGLMYPVAAR